jgi:hypothetical protein
MVETLAGPYTLKQILQDHWAFFVAKHGHRLRASIIEEVDKVLACRDPLKAGYHLYRCPAHPEMERIVPHSCKSRFCSSCGKVMTDNWMEHACSKFLDVPYRHIVWTIPDKLWNIFLWDRKLLNILFTAARVVILEWCRQRGFIPGIVMVVHTFGSQVNVNTHIHMLVTEGGLNLAKNGWVHNDYFPWAAFKDPWKYHVKMPLCRRMKEMISEGKIGTPYRELGTGQPFRGLVGSPVAAEMVRPCGVEPCFRPLYHVLHRPVCQTAGYGPKPHQGLRRGIRHVRV